MEFDVVIAGGGPNGVMVACELALCGVRSVVLESRIGPKTEQRANGMVGQVVRVLHRRGLYRRLTGEKKPHPAPRFMFGAFPVDFTDLPRNDVRLIMVPQRKVEETLWARARELGVDIREGHTLTGLAQKDDMVAVDVEGPDGGYRLETRFLVGADGGKSPTRKLAGIDFVGVTRDDSVSRAAHISVPERYRSREGLIVPGFGVVPPFQHTRTERGMVSYAPFPDGRTLLSVGTRERPDTGEPFTLEELREVAAYVLGVPLPFEAPDGPGPHLMRRIAGGNTRIAEHYRSGRILLVGDAAHVQSALGGQGLNLGLQDAVNLGWKLAATVKGTAPEGLLDTYETERRPAAERVIMQTEAQSVLIGPGREVTALRTLFGELLQETAVRQRLADLITGSDLRYDMGGGEPPVGSFAPDDVPAQPEARPVLVDATGRLRETAAPWGDRIDVVRGRGASLFVRPDGYVAWASKDSRPDRTALRKSLEKWLGAPTAE